MATAPMSHSLHQPWILIRAGKAIVIIEEDGGGPMLKL